MIKLKPYTFIHGEVNSDGTLSLCSLLQPCMGSSCKKMSSKEADFRHREEHQKLILRNLGFDQLLPQIA